MRASVEKDSFVDDQGVAVDISFHPGTPCQVQSLLSQNCPLDGAVDDDLTSPQKPLCLGIRANGGGAAHVQDPEKIPLDSQIS